MADVVTYIIPKMIWRGEQREAGNKDGVYSSLGWYERVSVVAAERTPEENIK